MHLLTLILTAVAATLALADFDLYKGFYSWGDEVDPSETWYIFASPPNCNDVYSSTKELYSAMDDVSGDKTGVRCQGTGCDRVEVWSDPTDINVIEMHFTNDPLWHFTIYKDRGYPYKMYGLDEKTYGECIPYPGHHFGCFKGIEERFAVRKFRCYIDVTVDQIESGSR